MLKMLQERKMSAVEILDLSFKIFKQKFKILSLIVLVFAIPLSFASSFILEKSIAVTDIVNSSVMSGTVNLQAFGQLWMYLLTIVLISVLISPIGSVAISIVVKKTLHEEEMSGGKALLQAFEKGPTIILAGIVYSISIAFGLIFTLFSIYLAIFSFIWVMYLLVIWYFYYISIAIDDVPAMTALTQSQKIVKGQWWSIFRITFVIGFCIQGISFGLTAILPIGNGILALDFAYDILLYFIQSFVTVFMTMLYMNRKFLSSNNDTNAKLFSDM